MNKKTCLITMLFFHSICNAQIPNWEWAYCGGGNGHDMGGGIIADASGNIYTTGYIGSPSITFGSITLTTSGANDVFVVKYDASGNVIWAKKFGGIHHEWGYAITVDHFSGVYITGSFNSPSITFNGNTILNNGIGNIFIVKYDSSGNEVWATSAGGTSSDVGRAIAADVFGNTYVTGEFSSPSISFGSTTLTNSGGQDIFIAKFDVSGSPVWAKKAGGYDSDSPWGICSDIVGNVYTVGTYWSDSISFDSTTIINGGQTNFYVAKFDPSGNMLWVKNAGGVTGFEFAMALGLTIDGSGNSYVTGTFLGTGITFGTYSLSCVASSLDVCVSKYDVNGNVLWAKKAGGSNDEWGERISIDAGGNSFVAGRFEGPTATLGTTVLTNNGYTDCHVTKFDASGNVIWATGFGGPQWEYCDGITTDANGNTYITGEFRSPSVAFGSITLTNADTNNTADYFIAKFGSTTGISEENYSTNSTDIYPNPFSDNLTIDAGNNELSEVIFYDIASRKLLQQQFTNSTSINTSKLAKGIYLYVVRNKDDVVKKGKVIKD